MMKSKEHNSIHHEMIRSGQVREFVRKEIKYNTLCTQAIQFKVQKSDKNDRREMKMGKVRRN